MLKLMNKYAEGMSQTCRISVTVVRLPVFVAAGTKNWVEE